MAIPAMLFVTGVDILQIMYKLCPPDRKFCPGENLQSDRVAAWFLLQKFTASYLTD